GTAKGTFFAHFKDKDALMDLILGARIDALLDDLQGRPAPKSVPKLTEALMPVCALMTYERYVFDVILRHSGATAVEEIGPIAMTFGRQIAILESWLSAANFRQDISAELQAEGVHAFMLQAMATKFCALHNSNSIQDRLNPYLKAWLKPAL
ncbi:MAG: TetR/AcrR family transcriptional regulator, partial [Pseudomonadota bacterium]